LSLDTKRHQLEKIEIENQRLLQDNQELVLRLLQLEKENQNLAGKTGEPRFIFDSTIQGVLERTQARLEERARREQPASLQSGSILQTQLHVIGSPHVGTTPGTMDIGRGLGLGTDLLRLHGNISGGIP
jgi:hypothetical protein